MEPLKSRAPHAAEPEALLQQLGGSRKGLGGAEAARRLREHGANALATARSDNALKRLLLQFHNVLIYILLVAAVGTAVLGHWIDSGVILGVVLINAAIGYAQEGKAEKALDAIRDMLSPRARVLREGRSMSIDARELVPGDIVLLESGDRVPADLRLLEQRNLRVDEAVLTGESEPVDKDTQAVASDASLGDRFCMVFSSTLVVAGRASGLVVATGAATEIGRVSDLLARVQRITTPLLQQIAQFARWLSVGIVGLAALTFAFGVGIRGYNITDMALAALSIAVAAIPEGLPAIMTITLAIGVQGMARRNAIIRRLPAVETLGSVTVICSDKTGTLTRNEMTVTSLAMAHALYSVSGSGYAPEGAFRRGDAVVSPAEDPLLCHLLRCGLACNDATLHQSDGQWQVDGDPTEGALVAVALKAGLDGAHIERLMPRTDSIPFESSQQYMATLHHDDNGDGLAVVKGAPERILGMCSHQRDADGEHVLDATGWQPVLDDMAAQGQRLLAIAVRDTTADHRRLEHAHIASGMTLLGVVGMMDPPRAEAIEAVAQCHSAGIRVKMVTGDHAITARAIGARLGIGDGSHALEGRDIEGMDDATLRRRARDVDIFARTSPEHKLRLVEALQADGQVVAMTGDGVNDAPALKRADVGVAMGRKGTEAAKEAAEMVLADDNFASIARAVAEGRGVYDNLRKAILFILPTNGGQAFTVVAAIALGTALPLTPVQVLWVNMVIAVTLALALAFEAPEPDVMQRAPRQPGTPILSRFLLWRIVFVSALLVAGTFGHFLWMTQHGATAELARTVAINTLVIGQLFYLFNSRYILRSSLSLQAFTDSRPVLLSVTVLILLQAAFSYAPPLQALFGTTAMPVDAWLRALAFGVALFIAVETEKLLLRRFIRLDVHASGDSGAAGA